MRGNLLAIVIFAIGLGLWSVALYGWFIDRPHIQYLPVTT